MSEFEQAPPNPGESVGAYRTRISKDWDKHQRELVWSWAKYVTFAGVVLAIAGGTGMYVEAESTYPRVLLGVGVLTTGFGLLAPGMFAKPPYFMGSVLS